MKILVVRTDRIGDVVLSLPLAEVLKNEFPDSEIHYLISESTKDLLKYNPYIDKVITISNQGFLAILKTIRKERFDVALLLFPTFSLSVILYLARIPKRIGTGFRWYSFLMNKRLYEHRHTSEKHELEYNLGLLRKLGIIEPVRKPKLYVDREEDKKATSFLKNIGFDSKQFIVVHPGSGGSTLTWPEENFKSLVKLLSKESGYQILLTGTKKEYSKAERIREGCNGNVVNIAGKTNLRELVAIISQAQLFISIGTGPMHIASAVDTKVLAFFPPSRSTRKTRWYPFSTSLILEPPVAYCKRCIKERCKYYNCLSLISPEEVMHKLQNKRKGSDPWLPAYTQGSDPNTTTKSSELQPQSHRP